MVSGLVKTCCHLAFGVERLVIGGGGGVCLVVVVHERDAVAGVVVSWVE